MNPSAFFSRAKANEGIKLSLSLPDGTPTEEWLMIRGVDSDQFRSAYDDFRRSVVDSAAIKDEAERKNAINAGRVRLVSALVIGWSFDAEFTDEALAEFLTEAPHIAEEVDRLASDRRRFFGKRSTSLVKA